MARILILFAQCVLLRFQKRVHFVWMCRSRNEFTMFKWLMHEITADARLKDHFKLNLHVSEEMEISDSNSKVMREIRGFGAMAKVFTGRPKWNRIFREVRKEDEAARPRAVADGTVTQREIGVFLCGPSVIGKQLKKASRMHTTKQTLFIFKTEHF